MMFCVCVGVSRCPDVLRRGARAGVVGSRRSVGGGRLSLPPLPLPLPFAPPVDGHALRPHVRRWDTSSLQNLITPIFGLFCINALFMKYAKLKSVFFLKQKISFNFYLTYDKCLLFFASTVEHRAFSIKLKIQYEVSQAIHQWCLADKSIHLMKANEFKSVKICAHWIQIC